MKRTASVAELLDISSRRKYEREVFEDISIDEDYELSEEPTSSQLKYEKVSTVASKKPSEGLNSVQGLLMNGKTKKLTEPEVISLDSDGDQYMMSGRKVKDPPHFKKTSLKDLFSNFSHQDVKSEKRHSKAINEDVPGEPPKRCHKISKLKELETPLPSCQLVQPPTEIQHRTLDLKNADPLDYHPPQINSEEYASLRNQVDVEQPAIHETMMAKELTNTKVWPQLNKPEKLQQVMLENSMKKAVYEWIEKAFVKLKSPTGRAKLLMKKNGLEGVDNLGGFIVEDHVEENDESPSIDFVPLMILHGEGIGKNTLIEVILQKMNGTIYEINTSSNRSKKDILDNLLEFSTTHYVKGQGSKGIILLDDVDVIFKEHDKFFWGAVEKLLWQTRRPVVLTCRNLSLVPNNLIQLAQYEQSLFHAKRVSVGTMKNFLTMFCARNGIIPNDKVLHYLSNTTHRDIRKALLELQFYCLPPGIFTLGRRELESNHETLSLHDVAVYSDMLSHGDIISNNCHWKSAILQDKDLSLFSYESRSILDCISDDQDRLRHDYMIDNKIHLFDDDRRPLLPFELDVGEYLESRLLACYKGPNPAQKIIDKKFNKMKETSVAFLSSRITNVARRTRSSRRFRTMLESFHGNYPQTAIDELINFQFEKTNRTQLAELINPYVLRIAEADLNKRRINTRLFKHAISGLSESEYCRAIAQLSREGLLRQPYFESDPTSVIDNWK